MSAPGYVRPLDGLGRIVVPKEFRVSLGLAPADQVEIIPVDGGLLLRPYRPICPCGATTDLIQIGSERRCRRCVRELLGDAHA